MKTKTPYVKPLLLLFCLVFITSVSVKVSAQLLFQSSFEGTNPFSGLSSTQACCSYSVAANTSVVNDGAKSFRAEVRRNDPAVSSGYRAEVTIPSVTDQGDMWYGYSSYFENFPAGGGGHAVQWHPNNSGGSATISMWVNDGKFDVCVNPTGSGSVTHQSGTLKRIESNRWYDFVWHIKWSAGGDGIIEVWLDGELYFTYRGATSTTGAYFKLGMNRWSMTNDWIIYYDNLKVGRNVDYATVAPPTVNIPANQAPIARAGNDINLTLPSIIATLNGSGSSDPDGTITNYSWSRVSGPTVFSLLDPLGVSTLVTGLLQGSYAFKLTVTDNRGATSSDTVVINVNPLIPPPNQPPVANAGNNISITLPTNSVNLNGSATDADGSIDSYSWTRVSGPTTYNISDNNAASPTVSGLVAGVYVFRVTATDDDGATDTDDVQVTVNAAVPTNQPPVANAGNNIEITLPTNSVDLNGSATDADGSIDSYSWTRVSGPATYNISDNNAASPTVSGLVAGVYVFRVTVTDDDGATDTDDVQVTVNAAAPVNQPPSVYAGNNITITLPTAATALTGSASDADGSISNISWVTVTAPSTPNLTNSSSLSPTVSNLVAGRYVFRLTVTDDDGATATDTVQVRVNAAPNQAPTVNAGNNISITLPVNTATLSGTAADTDGTISNYAWTRVSGPATFNFSHANAISTSADNLVAGTYVFRLTVTDDDGATAWDNVQVTVNAAQVPNQPPVATTANNITITLPVNTATLSGTGSDVDGTVVSYGWARISGPTTFSIGNATSASTAVTGLVQGVYVFRLTVRDNDGATGSDDITVTVNPAPVNQPPVANAGNNVILTLPANSTTLNGSSSSDPDGVVASYGWSRISGPTVFNIGNGTSAITSLTGLVQGVYVFRLSVRDEVGAISSDDVTITVNPAPPVNQAPVAAAGNNVVLTLPANSTTLTGTGSSDVDGTIATYAWARVSGPSTYTIASGTSATTALTGLVQGVYVFRLTVRDNDGATDTDDITVTVNAAPPVNQPPVAAAGNNIVLTLPANSTTLNGTSSSDPDGTVASYGWARISGPTTFTIGNGTSATTSISGLVQGVYVFRLTVRDDDGATDSDDITITVNAAPVNQPPVAAAGNNIVLTLPANSTTLNGAASSDPDGNIASYGWARISGPTTFTIGNGTSASTSLSGLVQGVYVFRLTVRDDDGAIASDDITVTVNAAIVPNTPPVARAGNDLVLTLPTNSTTLNGTGSTDADGNIVAYAWTRVSGPNTFNMPNAANASAPVSGLVQGTYVFRLTVRDNDGATDTDDVTITVNAAPNTPPVARAGNDITITLPVSTANLNGSGSTDANGTIVAYAWSRVSGPGFNISNGSTASATLTSLVQGVYVFRLTVRDNQGATATDDVRVTVLPAPVTNLPPVARASDALVLLPVDSVSISAAASSDADGTITAYQWTVVSGPTNAVAAGGNTNTLSLSGLDFGEYIVELKVTDDDGATGTTTVKVDVKTQNADRVYAQLYPNPAVNSINLRYVVVGFAGKVRLSILDARMRVVSEQTVNKDLATLSSTLDISRLNRGVYFLYISRTDGKRTMLKFIKY